MHDNFSTLGWADESIYDNGPISDSPNIRYLRFYLDNHCKNNAKKSNSIHSQAMIYKNLLDPHKL